MAELIGAILAGIALLSAGAFWLMSNGPVSLDWLAPYVATVFARAEPGLVARVDHTFLTIGEGPRLEILAQGLHVKRADGGAELSLPEVALSLSPEAALLGTVAPTRIVLSEPALHLLREADGSFHFGLGGEAPGADDWAESLLRDLAQPPDKVGPFGYLSEIEVRAAALTVDDRALGVTWEAKRADATLFRRPEGIAGTLSAAIDRGGQTAELRGDIHYDTAPHRLEMGVSFTNLRPALFAAAAPALQRLATFDLPIDGQISVTLNTAELRVADFWSDLRFGNGRIVDDNFAGGALAIIGGHVRAAYVPDAARIDVQDGVVELDVPSQAKIDFTATVNDFDGTSSKPLDFTGRMQVHDLVAASLPRLWPEWLAPPPREWVMAHVQGGVVTGGEVKLAGKILPNAPGGPSAEVSDLSGTFAYRDLVLEYFRPLSAARAIAGTGSFDLTKFELTLASGTVRGAKVTGGTVRFTGLEKPDQEGIIDVAVQGPLQDFLSELDTKPYRFAHALGIDLTRVAGTAETNLHFRMPMRRDLRASQVQYEAHGTFSSVEVGKIFFNRDLTSDQLQFEVGRDQFTVAGQANLEHVPVTLEWIENFGRDPVRTRYHLAGTFDDAARQRLGLKILPDYVSGPVAFDLAFARQRDGIAESNIKLGLRDAKMEAPKFNWRKAPGEPASAQCKIESREGMPVSIEDIHLTAPQLDATLDVTLTGEGPDAMVARANIGRLVIGKTDVAGTVARRAEGGWTAQLHGTSFDASALLGDLERAPTRAESEPPLVVEADLDRLILAPERVASGVKARLYSDGVHWRTASIDAAPAEGSTLSLRYDDGKSAAAFHLETNDFGAVLRLLDISSKVKGGHVTVVARTEDHDKTRVLVGTLEGSDYRLVDAPGFARLLSLASFTGPASLANGQGIPFTALRGKFVLADGKIRLEDARAYGEAIGVNASGLFDYSAGTLDLNGTVVPAYMLNSLLSNIPVIGSLLMGGEGEGIFGANFHVAGSSADPVISVNPLSALAPGFLRRLFLFNASPPPDSTTPTVGTGNKYGG
jgi:AsmA-like C-terminal region/Protein of unknown function